MKILLINGSPRMNGNTRIALETIIDGLRANRPDCEVELVDAAKHKISGCVACESCRKKGSCVANDDTNPLVQKVVDADVVILGTPVYWWGMSAQLKLYIDKWYSRGTALGAMQKKLGLVTVGGAPTDDREYALIHGQIECICDYMGWDLGFSEAIFATAAGEIRTQPAVLDRLGDLYKTI